MSLLDEKRIEINNIDTRLTALFEERMHIVKDILRYKQEHDLPVLDSSREAENISRVKSLLQDNALIPYLEDWYRYTMKVSKEYQNELKAEKK